MIRELTSACAAVARTVLLPSESALTSDGTAEEVIPEAPEHERSLDAHLVVRVLDEGLLELLNLDLRLRGAGPRGEEGKQQRGERDSRCDSSGRDSDHAHTRSTWSPGRLARGPRRCHFSSKTNAQPPSGVLQIYKNQPRAAR